MYEPEVSAWDEVRRRLVMATAGRYTVRQQIGEGGMGAVFLGEDRLGRPIAIKVLAPRLMADPSFGERFQREARTIARLRHPHIVDIHDFDEGEGLSYFVMTYVPGASLARIIVREGSLPHAVVRAWTEQLASALAYAHRAEVVHRDVKPSNILFDADGDVMLTDFGIAQEARQDDLTSTGMIVGSPPYVAPERWDGSRASPASDQYALGIVAYEMLTGSPPFTGSTLMVMEGHARRPPPPIRDIRPDCPEDVIGMVERMLAKRPDDRWPSLAALHEHLGRDDMEDTSRERIDLALAAEPVENADDPTVVMGPTGPDDVPPRPNTAVAPAPGRGSARRGGRPGVWIGGGVASLVLAGLVGWLARSGRDAPPPVPVLTAIRIGVPDSVRVGDRIALAATGEFDQGDPRPLEDLDWGTADTVVTIEGSSLIARFVGSARITARAGDVASSATLRVHDPSIAPATGVLMITVSVSGTGDPVAYRVRVDENAEVALEGDGTATVPSVSAGEHSVRLLGVEDPCRSESGNPLTVLVSPSETAVAAFSVRCAASPPPARRGILNVLLIGAYGELFVDDRPQGAPRLRFADLDVVAGARALRVERDGYRPIDTTVVVPADGAITVRLQMVPGGR